MAWLLLSTGLENAMPQRLTGFMVLHEAVEHKVDKSARLESSLDARTKTFDSDAAKQPPD